MIDSTGYYTTPHQNTGNEIVTEPDRERMHQQASAERGDLLHPRQLHCRACGAPMTADYGDHLCQVCFVARGMEAVVELLSSQVQQTLFESLIVLSHQAHQREQTDTAYHALSAAYHAAYEPEQLNAIIREATRRADEWEPVLDECGAVRARDYQRLAHEARLLRDDLAPAVDEPSQPHG